MSATSQRRVELVDRPNAFGRPVWMVMEYEVVGKSITNERWLFRSLNKQEAEKWMAKHLSDGAA